jgi:monoamine oxidase
MPRSSSLLRIIRRWSSDHATAEHFGVMLGELQDIRRENAPSRRHVLKGGTALGAAALLGFTEGLRSLPAKAQTAPQIAIVGGGIAGLNAALTLLDKGYVPTIFEASTRLGGRMHSERSYWGGQVSEYCAEFIDSNHKTILKLVARFGLSLTDVLAGEPANSTETYYFQNNGYVTSPYYTFAQATLDFAPVYKAAKSDLTAAGYPTLWNNQNSAGKALDSMSVYDWIQTRVPGGISSTMGRLLNTAYDQEYGALTTDQSALNIVYLLAYQPTPNQFSIYGVSDQRYHILGGNDRLPTAIANYLQNGGAPINTGHRLTSVTQSSGKVTLGFNGQTYPQGFDQVILALPFAVLRNLDYSGAGFDPRKQAAITQLGAGKNAKLILQFNNRYWNNLGPWGVSNGDVYSDLGFTYDARSDSYTDLGFQNTWDTTRGQLGAAGLLTDYTGGGAAAAFTPSAPYTFASDPKTRNYAKAFLAELGNVFPGIGPSWSNKAILSASSLDPNLLLSYSYWRVGQYTSIAGYEGVAQGSIHFAGEHCSVDFQGYMEGAAAEGRRAGVEVYHALTGK